MFKAPKIFLLHFCFLHLRISDDRLQNSPCFPWVNIARSSGQKKGVGPERLEQGENGD